MVLPNINCLLQRRATTVIRHVIIRQANSSDRIDKSKLPVLDEADLDEKFISGSGPGGQSVNKSINCCFLRHKPTGLIVKVHKTRSLEKNRQIARELLIEKLDNHINGEYSVENQKARLARHHIATRQAQRARVRELKEQFKNKLMGKESGTQEHEEDEATR